MNVLVAKGQSLSLSSLAHEMFLEEYPHYEKVADSRGILQNVGGALATLSATSFSYDEADDIMNQFGVSLYTPSAEITIRLPDLHRIPTIFYGIAELDVYRTEGDWWSDFRIKLSGLVRA